MSSSVSGYTNTTLLFANNAGSTLAGPISNTSTALSLQSGGGALFPNPGAGQSFIVTITDAATGLLHEIVQVLSVSGDTFSSVVRGQEGTTALNWLANDIVQQLWTAGQAATMNTFVRKLPSTVFYVNGSNVSQTFTPDTGGSPITVGAGNDTNSGSQSAPFKTIQAALDYAGAFQSFATVIVYVAPGTYAGFSVAKSGVPSWSVVGSGTATCVLDSSSTLTNNGRGVACGGSTLMVTGFEILSYYESLLVNYAGTLYIGNVKVHLDTGSGLAPIAAYSGSQISFGTPFTTSPTISYSGSGQALVASSFGCVVDFGYHDAVVTYHPTFAASSAVFSVGFVNIGASANAAVNPAYCSFSGSATGPRFYVAGTGGIQFGGGGTSFFPGSTAGVIDSTTYGWVTA